MSSQYKSLDKMNYHHSTYMRFQVLYYGNFDFQASSYDEAHVTILKRNLLRMKACGFRLELSNYEVVDMHDTDGQR